MNYQKYRTIFTGLNIRIFILCFLIFLFNVNFALSSESYKIGPEDVIEIQFWQDNSLDATVKVRQDGKISLDIIGEIDVAGLTTTELEKTVVRQMGRYNKAISQAVVRVIEYNHLKVFLSGQSQNPGRYSFEVIPDLWTIINEAGGITELGDLSRVLIIGGENDSGKVEVVNVSALVTTGRLQDLPKIHSGETIEIPRTLTGLPVASLSHSPTLSNIYYVFGAVHTPGASNLEKDIDILDAITLAGGSNEMANLKKIRVISKDGMGTQVTMINLEKYSESAIACRYFIKPEDVIYLPQRRSGFLGIGMMEWIAMIGGVGSMILIANQLSLFGLGDEETH